MGKGPDEPETPAHEEVQRENAIKNLAFANDLHDRNFDAMSKATLRDKATTAASKNNADMAQDAARRTRDPSNPLTMVAGDTQETLAMKEVSRVMSDKSGDRQMVKRGEGVRQDASALGNRLSRLEHKESSRQSALAHRRYMSDIDTAGALAGGAYYATDGFTNNPLARSDPESLEGGSYDYDTQKAFLLDGQRYS